MSKIRDFQHIKETRSREVDPDNLTTNYMAGNLFRPYSSCHIVGINSIRSKRTTFVMGPLYKEASGDGKQRFFFNSTLPATRSRHAGGIDLDINLQNLLHHHSHLPPLVIVDIF